MGIASLFTEEETKAQGYRVTVGAGLEPRTMWEGRHILLISKDSETR